MLALGRVRRTSRRGSSTSSDGDAHDEYTPRSGVLGLDEATERVGRIVDHIRPHRQLRPPCGGREWDAHGRLRPATSAERLSCPTA
ncbi:hypothetical protein [Streptomyces sp. Tue6028]|uniref:hypothetical protein n=1 Tax=Streptomyces sp. Tue6028 TaxID=2036037 RepID=UPI003EBB1754